MDVSCIYTDRLDEQEIQIKYFVIRSGNLFMSSLNTRVL